MCSHYLKSGFIIDIMACLPYDLLDTFTSRHTSTITDVFSILKVRPQKQHTKHILVCRVGVPLVSL
ncbi:MAG: hypothetical protein ACK55Z_19645, partial [bacterium]